MSHKNYHLITGLVFLVIALLHVSRVLMGWDAVLNGQVMPMWASWVAIVVLGYLGYLGLKMGRGK